MYNQFWALDEERAYLSRMLDISIIEGYINHPYSLIMWMIVKDDIKDDMKN